MPLGRGFLAKGQPYKFGVLLPTKKKSVYDCSFQTLFNIEFLLNCCLKIFLYNLKLSIEIFKVFILTNIFCIRKSPFSFIILKERLLHDFKLSIRNMFLLLNVF